MNFNTIKECLRFSNIFKEGNRALQKYKHDPPYDEEDVFCVDCKFSLVDSLRAYCGVGAFEVRLHQIPRGRCNIGKLKF